MRVTQNITYNSYINDIMRRQKSFYDLSKQLSTGKRVTAPSDDPVKAEKILTSKNLIDEYGQYERNLDSGISYLSIAEESLSNAQDILMRIHEMAVQAANGTENADSRANTAKVVSELFNEVVGLGNTKYDGRYIFSGYLTDSAAFDATGAYSGDTNKYQIKIGSGSFVTVGVNGGEVFKGVGGGVDILQGILDLETALNSNDTAGIQTAIDTMSSSIDQVSDAIAGIGAKQTRLTAVKSDIEDTKLNLTSIISSYEDADIPSVVSELRLSQIALEAAMSSAGKVFSVNIFDYL